MKGRSVSLPKIDLGDQVIDEPGPALGAARQDCEVTVGTDRGAEGDVEVEAGVRGCQILSFQYPGRRLWCATATTRIRSASSR